MGDDNENTSLAYDVTGRYRFPSLGYPIDLNEESMKTRIPGKMYIIE